MHTQYNTATFGRSVLFCRWPLSTPILIVIPRRTRRQDPLILSRGSHLLRKSGCSTIAIYAGPAEQGRPGGPWPTQLQKIVLQPDGDLAELPVKGMR